MSDLTKLSFLLLLFFVPSITSFGQETKIVQKIWESVGGQRIGTDVRYIAFSAKGNIESVQQISSERQFLVDRQTGNCRFDGANASGNAVTLLFNFKNSTTNKLYIDSKEAAEDKTLLKSIRSQLLTDLQLLLLPTLLDSKQIQLKEKGTKLIGDQKLVILTFQSTAPIFGSALRGDVFIETNTGEIKKYDKADASQRISYDVSAYKEIGEGFRLPTIFIATSDDKKSCSFSLVSSFIQVEQSKFNTL